MNKDTNGIDSSKEKITFLSTTTNFVVINIENESGDKHEELAENKIIRKEKFRKYSGVIFALVSGLCYTLTGLLVKVLKHYDPINLTFWRFFGYILLTIPILLYTVIVKKENIYNSVWPLRSNGKDEDGASLKTLLFVLASAFFGSTAMIFIFCSLSYMSIADATVCLFSGPVFVVIFAHFCLKEKCGMFTIPIAMWTLLGVIIITRPPILTGESQFNENTLTGTAFCFGALFCLSVYYIIMRKLRQVHIILNSIIMGIFGLIESVIIAILFDVLQFPEGVKDILLTITLSILAFFGQTFIILALKFEEAGIVSLVRSSDVIFAFLWQIIFLGIIPDIYSYLGAIIVVIGVLLTTFRKWVSTLPKQGNWTRQKFGFLVK